MPRYEFAEGGSNKFWEINLTGKSFTTTYGKIGTDGQTTIKTFGSDAEAKKEADKITAEKVKKGYALAAGTPASGVKAAPAPKAAPAAKAAPAKAAPAPAPAAKTGARYFEFSEGTSNKFWEVSLDGNSVRTRYGKIGTPGQSTIKDFSAKSDAQKELDKLVADKDQAMEAQQYELASTLRQKERAQQDKLQQAKADWLLAQSQKRPEVTDEDIAEVVSMWTGIPVRRLAEEETAKLLRMEEVLHSKVIGQAPAVTMVSRAVRRARAGLKDPRRPIGVFFFVGPTGTGKTHLAKQLAEFMFGSEENVVKIDMSDYMERHNVSRLVGSPPGYVGYEEGGQLTETVRRKSYCVILLDEIEKAHPEVFNILLQIFDEGRLADAKGRTVDFRNTIIIMTSNLAQKMLKSESALGFRTHGEGDDADMNAQYERMKERVQEEMKRFFRPEFLNRIDATVVFTPLTKPEIRQIVELELAGVRKQLASQEITLVVTDEAKDHIASVGYDSNFGARPLARQIQNEIADPLAEMLLQGKFHSGDTVSVHPADGKLVIEKTEAVEAPKPVPVAP